MPSPTAPQENEALEQRFREFFRNLPTLETERVVLRPLRPEDAQAIFDYGSDQTATRYTSWSRHETLPQAQAFVESVQVAYRDGRPGPFGIELKAEGRVVGTAGFLSMTPTDRRGEIGFALAPRLWGQGLMSESVRRVLQYGFADLGLNRIEGLCMVANRSSTRVMEKVGMQYEGVLREYKFVRGAYRDLKVYSILRRDWDEDRREARATSSVVL